MVWYSMVLRAVVQYGKVCYGMIRHGMLWNDAV